MVWKYNSNKKELQNVALSLEEYPVLQQVDKEHRLDFCDGYPLDEAEIHELELPNLDQHLRGLDTPVKITVIPGT